MSRNVNGLAPLEIDTWVNVMIQALEAKNPVTASHSIRVGYFSAQIGRAMGWEDAECKILRIGGMLHDIGKIGIPNAILDKHEKLNDQERRTIEHHTEIGFRILGAAHSLKSIADVAKDHHLRPDDSGYPREENGQRQYKSYSEVSPFTRVVTVADVFDILWTGRVYQDKKDLKWIMAEFHSCIGMQFDEAAVRGLIQYLKTRFGEEKIERYVAQKQKKAA